MQLGELSEGFEEVRVLEFVVEEIVELVKLFLVLRFLEEFLQECKNLKLIAR